MFSFLAAYALCTDMLSLKKKNEENAKSSWIIGVSFFHLFFQNLSCKFIWCFLCSRKNPLELFLLSFSSSFDILRNKHL